MNISTNGKNLIKSFEGCSLYAYKAVPTEQYYTIGWGHYGPDVYAGMTITQSQADALFDQDIVKYVNAVANTNFRFIPNQNQFDALCSFCYNLGTGIMSDFIGMTAIQVANEIPLYNKSGGVILDGLVRRRQAEVTLFNNPISSPPSNPAIPDYGEYETKRYTESGTCYPNTTINIRTEPNAQKSSNIVGQYFYGESVIYDLVVHTNNYVYISWIGGSGARRYMAIKNLITGELFASVSNSNTISSSEYEINRYTESGICYPSTTINIRTEPNSQKSSNIVGQYFYGESVIYDLVVITNKYVYISWIGGSGARRYMTVKDVQTGERWETVFNSFFIKQFIINKTLRFNIIFIHFAILQMILNHHLQDGYFYIHSLFINNL